MKTHTHRQTGFTLIELMIVVSIIAIIASIAVPSLLRSRMAANESSALTAVRTIVIGQVSYQTFAYKDTAGNGMGDFGNLDELHDPMGDGQPGYIDDAIASGFRQGYEFDMQTMDGAPGVAPTFILNANPVAPGNTGIRHFFTNQSGIIRVNTAGPAGPDDPSLQ